MTSNQDLSLQHSSLSLKENKRLDFQLAKISGLGRVSATKLLIDNAVQPTCHWKDLRIELKKIINQILANNGTDDLPLENRLKSEKMSCIRELMRTKCYRGMRHKTGKRVRNQRTRTSNRVNRVIKGFQKKKTK